MMAFEEIPWRSGWRPGRTRPDEVTLFESQGVARGDAAVAARVLAQARERGVGTEIAL
jgi:ornithine cyclodeaminase